MVKSLQFRLELFPLLVINVEQALRAQYKSIRESLSSAQFGRGSGPYPVEEGKTETSYLSQKLISKELLRVESNGSDVQVHDHAQYFRYHCQTYWRARSLDTSAQNPMWWLSHGLERWLHLEHKLVSPATPDQIELWASDLEDPNQVSYYISWQLVNVQEQQSHSTRYLWGPSYHE